MAKKKVEYAKITLASHGKTFEAYEEAVKSKPRRFFCDAVEHNNEKSGCPNPDCFRNRGG